MIVLRDVGLVSRTQCNCTLQWSQIGGLRSLTCNNTRTNPSAQRHIPTTLVHFPDNRQQISPDRPHLAVLNTGHDLKQLIRKMKVTQSLCSTVILLELMAASASANAIVPSNVTASDSRLQTWWHDNGEINYQTPVRQQNVRQSHIYSAWVKPDAESTAE
jgi:hypothetical protein